MSDIIPGVIEWNIIQGDALDDEVLLEGYSLAGKKVAMDVKEDPESGPILRFRSDDGSIVIDPWGGDWLLTFKKTSLEMKVPDGRYLLDIEAYTTDEDTRTFARGTMIIQKEITQREK